VGTAGTSHSFAAALGAQARAETAHQLAEPLRLQQHGDKRDPWNFSELLQSRSLPENTEIDSRAH